MVVIKSEHQHLKQSVVVHRVAAAVAAATTGGRTLIDTVGKSGTKGGEG